MSGLLRFSGFELDLERQELRRGGRRVALAQQPFRALVLLATRAGQVVTREELRHALWPDGTHVDFERGINFCLNQVRTALRDPARASHFVETLPRIGYRFVAGAAGPVVPAAPDRPSIAVLPFENLSSDPEQAYFADGLAEDTVSYTHLTLPTILRV